MFHEKLEVASFNITFYIWCCAWNDYVQFPIKILVMTLWILPGHHWQGILFPQVGDKDSWNCVLQSFQNLQQLKLSLESNSFSFSFIDEYYDEISYEDTNGFQFQSNLFMSSAVFQNNDDATICSTHMQSHVANLDATKRVYQTDVKYVACEDMDLSLVPGAVPPSSSPPHSLP